MLIVTLIRGLPGSGKSYMAKELSRETGARVCTTDDYFLGKFDASKIAEAHQWNQSLARHFLESKESVIIPNTNIHLWEMRPYIELAYEFNAGLKILEPETDWAWDYKRCFTQCVHGVPKDVIKRMHLEYQTFESYEQIRTSPYPWES